MSLRVVLVILSCCATAHLLMACVMSLYARHRVQYLSLAWVNGIFGFILLGESFFAESIVTFDTGVLNPVILLALLAGVFLQSIYPLSIPMPGFLQWERMWRYARPIIVLFGVYALTIPFNDSSVLHQRWSDVADNLFRVEMLCRVVAVILALYYVANIFRLPRVLARNADVPRYLLFYCSALGFSVLFYLFVVLFYNVTRLMTYHFIFTVLNLYLFFRTLETIALELPQPSIETIEEEPVPAPVSEDEEDDFNEANLQRFHRTEYWMQHHPEAWTDSSFGRDRLCREVGLNRHLLLQSLRSQGYNNIHEYINRYRLEELKRRIRRGDVTSVADSVITGLGTVKTARSCFQKAEGVTLDSFLERHASRARERENA
ncbi:MAG: hypothetical protein K5945_08045 [Bacteroidaceae bacterium]|nr:hypothetical protein [Bacteroidaceae bacterium]